ncbi:MAG TPA: site-specific DNA-methyltransferase [Firmicutes bacterium]|nr:site-specific DNA-methyltransferase [Bacillota bacterium]
MEIKTVKISELRPHPKNPRVHPDSAIEKLERSIKEYGWTNPVLVSADGYVLAGHARLKAAEKAGIKEVPVIYLPLEGAKAEAYLIADNRLQDETDWDYEKLKDLLQDLDTGEFDIELTGFDVDEIEELIAQFAPEESEVEEDDFDPEENIPEIPVTQPGDIWILGRHRLLCGDATKPDDVSRLMEGKIADLIVTDPPYNVDYKGANGQTIKNDNMEDAQFKKFLVDAFKCADNALKPGGVFYIWHADSEGYNFRGACRDVGWEVRQCLIWNKNSFVMGRQDYHWKHEPCLYGWKNGAAHYFIDDRTQSTVIEDKGLDFKKMKKEELVALLKEIFSDKVSTTVINEDKPMCSAEHPTMKPLKLLERLIKNSSRQGELVLDTFGGSGSTMMTCEQLNRTCYMMEIDPVYCDVIVQRYINLKGHDGDVYLERDGNKIAFSNVT